MILQALKLDELSISGIVGNTRDCLKYPNAWDFPSENSNGLNNQNKAILKYSNLTKIGMGAPLSGMCILNSAKLNNVLIDNNCGGPAIWNETRLMVAVPIWDKSFFKGKFQRIGVVSLETQTVIKYKKKFRVLDFRSFDTNLLKGFDSPIHKMETLNFNINYEPIETTYRI